MEIREIFENRIKIEPKVMSIETLFNNEDRVNQTNYKPSYQRNYVWDDEKATYFIESILLGTEIPPLIYFRNSNKIEVIDGRQRYQTILRYIHNEFKLRKNGLQKLDNIGIANKLFKDLDIKLQDLFWDTKLRLIEFSFHSPNLIDEEVEEIVKKEIFKRYNSGITPLKPAEIDKAAYYEDDLNSFIKNKLQSDKLLSKTVSNVLHFDKPSSEIILKKIRQLLVQHKIPIKYYAIKKDIVISKYYDLLFSNIQEAQIPEIYASFISKINLINLIKKLFDKKSNQYNRFISECLFWALSIYENEGHSLKEITELIIDKLVNFFIENISDFKKERSSFAKELITRYSTTSDFFSKEFNIDFTIYIQYTQEFKQKNKAVDTVNEERTSFDELRINKPEPSSIAIIDICRLMDRQRFLIRPPYQRNEVINKKKSSAIIESILLGIKLPPIFVYKRKDEISEVLDGQQRLLSILGFIKKTYLDENNNIKTSDKNGFTLNLKNSILKNLNGKDFDKLSIEEQTKIRNFDLWIIEINYKNNENFEPIDLFIRLNNKPYPIKEDTFEMWNSYISRDIIDTIKSIHKNHSEWFYFRKNNSRMEDENIYTTLIYFQYAWNKIGKPDNFTPKELDIYKIVKRINFRVQSKNEITKVLENPDYKNSFIQAANEVEFNFIRKLKYLLSDSIEISNNISILNKNLDDIFNVENGRRTQQGFYALWHILHSISFNKIIENKTLIRQSLKRLFIDMIEIDTKQDFDNLVNDFVDRFKLTLKEQTSDFAMLGDISQVIIGANLNQSYRLDNSKTTFPVLKNWEFNYMSLKIKESVIADVGDTFQNKDFFEAKRKILIDRQFFNLNRHSTAFYDSKLIFTNEIIGCIITRQGFLPKYILAIISSRYNYNQFLTQNISQSTKDETKRLSVNDVKRFLIPIVSFDIQNKFAIIVDYILNNKYEQHITLFFERLLDAMVYEIVFPSQFKKVNCTVLNYLNNLKELTLDSMETNAEIILEAYIDFSNTKSEISASFLRLLTIDEIVDIENFN